MANFFDQFDAASAPAAPPPAGNYFDQFDAPSQGSSFLGTLKSLGTGAAQTALEFARGEQLEAEQRAMAFGQPNAGPTIPTGDAANAVLGLHQPTGFPERAAATVGSFLANPATYLGPEGLLSKMGTATAAGIGSEAAGTATQGTALETPARIAGGVLGGGAASLRPSTAAAAPTADELFTAARAGYQAPEVAALRIKPTSLGDAADAITADLHAAGFRDRNVPGTFAAIDELTNPLNPAAGTAADIDSVRKSLRVTQQTASNPMSPNHAEYGAASRAMGMIDDYMASLQPADLLAGDAQAASNTLSAARGNYAAASRLDRIGEAQYRAENNAGAANSGQNVNNAMRQQLKTILNNPAQRRGFSPAEIAQMEQVVRGTFTGNTARFLGNLFGGSGLGAIASAGTGFVAGGPAGALALPLAGQVARQVGNASTARNLSALDRMVAMRSPLAAQRASAVPAQTPRITGPQAALLAAMIFSRQHGAR